MLQKLKQFLFINTTTPQTIAKNTFWLFAGQVLSRLLRAAIVIYAARILGAESWGAFSYALGIAAFLTIFSDIGINALITKEASRHPELESRYLSTAFFIKLTLLLICAGAILIVIPFITDIPETRALMPILILVFIFDTLRDLGSALSRALEKMEIEAGGSIFANFAITAVGFAALYLYGTSSALAWSYAIGSGLGLVAVAFVLRKHFSHILSHFSRELVRPILETAWPFGLLGIMGAIMINTDIVMIGWLRTAEEVGYYSAAQKLILLAYVLPALLASSTFPVLSRLAASAPEEAKKLLKKSLKLILGTAILTVIFGLILGPWAYEFLFGAEYLPGLNVFKILLFSIILVYPGTLLGNALFAYDDSKYFLKFVITSTLGNALFNLLLIPSYGIEGAAASTIATQLITNSLLYFRVKKKIKI
jgi:O-antigen/teichoic acid export membrane protein